MTTRTGRAEDRAPGSAARRRTAGPDVAAIGVIAAGALLAVSVFLTWMTVRIHSLSLPGAYGRSVRFSVDFAGTPTGAVVDTWWGAAILLLALGALGLGIAGLVADSRLPRFAAIPGGISTLIILGVFAAKTHGDAALPPSIDRSLSAGFYLGLVMSVAVFGLSLGDPTINGLVQERRLVAVSDPDPDPDDAKIITLARSTRARASAAEGAAVRDETGRTYAAATVDLPTLKLSALRLAVAMAVSSGARSLEAAAVVTEARNLPDEDLSAVGDLGAEAPVFLAGLDGTPHTTL